MYQHKKTHIHIQCREFTLSSKNKIQSDGVHLPGTRLIPPSYVMHERMKAMARTRLTPDQSPSRRDIAQAQYRNLISHSPGDSTPRKEPSGCWRALIPVSREDGGDRVLLVRTQ